MKSLFDALNCFFSWIEQAIGHDMTVFLCGVLSVVFFLSCMLVEHSDCAHLARNT